MSIELVFKMDHLSLVKVDHYHLILLFFLNIFNKLAIEQLGLENGKLFPATF